MKNKPSEKFILDQRKRMLQELIKKRYSNRDDGIILPLILLFVGIGMIIYGGFAINWASILSGVFLVTLALILVK